MGAEFGRVEPKLERVWGFNAVHPVTVGTDGHIGVIFFSDEIGPVDALSIDGEDLLVAAGARQVDFEARLIRRADGVCPVAVSTDGSFAMARS